MAKKQKKTEIKRSPTKRQLSRWQRQKRTQRIIMIAGGLFFALIIAFVGYGYYDDQVKPFHKPVLRVNDTVFDMDYYLNVYKIYSRGLEPSRVSVMADMVIGAIIQNELIIQRAPEVGVVVTDDEIAAELEKLNLPDDDIYRKAYSAEVLTEKLFEEYIDPKVPAKAAHVNVQAMFLETEEMADEILRKLGDGDSFAKLAEEFSVEDQTREKGGDLGWLPEGMVGTVLEHLGDSLLGDIAFSLEPGTISQPTYDPSVYKEGGYWLIEVVERDADKSSHVRGILLGSLKEVDEIKERLVAGEDFAAVAGEASQHLESRDYGGDLGWVQKGYGNEVINSVAFELEPGVLSEPVRDDTVGTTGGYWVVQVLDKEADRELDEEVRGILMKEAFADWIEEQSETSVIEEYLSEEQKSWAVEYILGSRSS